MKSEGISMLKYINFIQSELLSLINQVLVLIAISGELTRLVN